MFEAGLEACDYHVRRLVDALPEKSAKEAPLEALEEETQSIAKGFGDFKWV